MSCFYSGQYIVKKIEEFMKEMKDSITKMDEEEFEEIVESVLAEVTAKHNNIFEESNFLWEEIRTHEFLFNRSIL